MTNKADYTDTSMGPHLRMFGEPQHSPDPTPQVDTAYLSSLVPRSCRMSVCNKINPMA